MPTPATTTPKKSELWGGARKILKRQARRISFIGGAHPPACRGTRARHMLVTHPPTIKTGPSKLKNPPRALCYSSCSLY